MRWWKKQKLKSRSPVIRRQTLEAIHSEGTDADLDLLIFALNDSSSEIRCLAAPGLGALRQEGSVPGLMMLLRDVAPQRAVPPSMPLGALAIPVPFPVSKAVSPIPMPASAPVPRAH